MMFDNPLVKQMLSTVIRYVLLFVAGYLVKEGIWTPEEADTAVTKMVDALLPIIVAMAVAGYGMYKTYLKQKAQVTAQALPAGATTEDVKVAMKQADAPPATLPADVQPRPMALP
jgi:hypothetical protein